MKSAMLIMAYNNFEILKLLISALDYKDNDIYIHIDKKCGNIDFSQFENRTKYSKTICLRNRINVKWGGYSQIETELALYDAAFNNMLGRKYDYFHLLSGVDFPLKSNEYISDFLERNKGKQFIGFAHVDERYFRDVLGLYHFMQGRRWYKLDRYFLTPLQKLIGISRYKDYSIFKKGANWQSITYDLVSSLLANKDWIEKTFKYSLCCDEVFLQTYVYTHKEFMKNVFCVEDEFKSCMRFIDWTRGNPYTFKSTDIKELQLSEALFARKFSPECIGMLRMLQKKSTKV